MPLKRTEQQVPSLEVFAVRAHQPVLRHQAPRKVLNWLPLDPWMAPVIWLVLLSARSADIS